MSSADLWEVADCLGIMLLHDKKAETLRAKDTRDVSLGALKLPVPLHVVSSALFQNHTVVLARSLGNLALMLVTRYEPGSPASIFVLDLAKLDKPPEDLLEALKLPGPQEVVDALQGAIVKTFHKTKASLWTAA